MPTSGHWTWTNPTQCQAAHGTVVDLHWQITPPGKLFDTDAVGNVGIWRVPKMGLPPNHAVS